MSDPESEEPDSDPGDSLDAHLAEALFDGSVLESLAPKLPGGGRIRLRDEESGPGAPVIDPRAAQAAGVPQGRGNYQLLGEIARGGMGVVLRGHDLDLGRDVALKVMHDRLVNDPVTLSRFVEEAQIGGQLQHPGIVPVYELGLMADERPFFTMKLVKGRTLSQLLSEREAPARDLQRFLSIFEDICQTVAYAHSRGVIHRDLKPSNVMVGAFGEVQVVDWGLAKVLQRAGATPAPQVGGRPEVSVVETVRSGSSSSGTASDSLAGSVMGTPAYMSPEQARGELDSLDERTDVFALGGILCEILTGGPLYGGSKQSAMKRAAEPDQAEFQSRLASSGADEPLVTLATACTAADVQRRPRDAGKVASAIRTHLEEVESRARLAQVRAARAVGLAVSALVVVLAIGGTWAWLGNQKQRRLERTQGLVDSALEDAYSARDVSDWPAALAAIGRARAHLEAGEADGALESRVASVADAVDRSDQRARGQREQLERRRVFLDEVEAVRAHVASTNQSKLAAYRLAFSRQGIDLQDRPDAKVIDDILGTGMPVEMGRALTDWSRVVRETERQSTPEVRRLIELALAVDDDRDRSRLRQALLTEDRVGILAMASGPEAEAYPPMTSIVLADALWWTGETESALRVLQRAERRRPDDFHLQAKLAIRHINRVRPADAYPHLKAAQALNPKSAWVLTYLGLAHREAGDLERAEDCLKRAVALDPKDALAHSHLGVVLAGSDRFDEAIASFRRAIDLDSDYAYTHGHLGRALANKGLYSEAIESYRRGVERAPDSDSMLNSLAWHLVTAPDLSVRDPQAAVVYAEQSVEIARDWPGMNTLGVCYYRAGMFARCAETIEEGIGLSPDGAGDASDFLYLALAHGQLSESAEAAEWYRKGVDWMNANELSASEQKYLPPVRNEAAKLLGIEEEDDE